MEIEDKIEIAKGCAMNSHKKIGKQVLEYERAATIFLDYFYVKTRSVVKVMYFTSKELGRMIQLRELIERNKSLIRRIWDKISVYITLKMGYHVTSKWFDMQMGCLVYLCGHPVNVLFMVENTNIVDIKNADCVILLWAHGIEKKCESIRWRTDVDREMQRKISTALIVVHELLHVAGFKFPRVPTPQQDILSVIGEYDFPTEWRHARMLPSEYWKCFQLNKDEVLEKMSVIDILEKCDNEYKKSKMG